MPHKVPSKKSHNDESSSGALVANGEEIVANEKAPLLAATTIKEAKESGNWLSRSK